MKVEMNLGRTLIDSKIMIGGVDFVAAIRKIEIVAAENDATVVTLELCTGAKVNIDGADIHLEYPHVVKQFFKGPRYGDPVDDIVEQ